MKICFLAPADSIHSYRWIKYFADKNYDIHWLSLVPNQFKVTKNIKFYHLKNFSVKFLNVILNIKSIRELVRNINPDIFHVHSAGTYGITGALSGFHPLILTVWGSDILMAQESKIRSFLKKYTLKKVDFITCDAEHMEEEMLKLGANPSKIKIINFGIDIQRFYPSSKDENLKKELGASDFKVVISVRRLEKLCDVETLIRAAPVVLNEFPKTKFIIIGEGSLKENLEKLAKVLRVAENIKFIGDIANEELPKYLRLADTFVSTTLSDAGIASSTAEAMACELPVIITDIADNKSWVKDGKNGFLIPIKNPELLAQRIIFLLKNKNIGREFGKINRKIIEERNDYFKEMAKIEDIYLDLAKK